MTQKDDEATRQARTTQESTTTEPAIRPAVDIFEDDTGITVEADMPGVSRDRLEVHIDSDSLSIEGATNIAAPEAMDALYADIGATRYQSSFSLSRELDAANIEARLQDGVLTLRIPKRAEQKPRKIEVSAG